MTTPIRAPITKPQWPAGLRLRIAVLNDRHATPPMSLTSTSAGLDRRKGPLRHRGNPIQSLLLAA
jgi:hypothetical protein